MQLVACPFFFAFMKCNDKIQCLQYQTLDSRDFCHYNSLESWSWFQQKTPEGTAIPTGGQTTRPKPNRLGKTIVGRVGRSRKTKADDDSLWTP